MVYSKLWITEYMVCRRGWCDSAKSGSGVMSSISARFYCVHNNVLKNRCIRFHPAGQTALYCFEAAISVEGKLWIQSQPLSCLRHTPAIMPTENVVPMDYGAHMHDFLKLSRDWIQVYQDLNQHL